MTVGPRLPADYHSRPVRIFVAGCGGTGSQVVSGLARLDTCLRALGHPGFEVIAFDPDRVSDANVGRQLFAPGDVGRPKADALIHRVNMWFALDWHAVPVALDRELPPEEPADILIGCVDSARARLDLAAASTRFQLDYWLDIGNEDAWGQVILGTPNDPEGLPTVLDLYPGLRDRPADDDGPSCSLAESLARQGAFINQAVATLALDGLWRIFRTGRIDRFAWFLNLDTGRMTSLASAPETLARVRAAGATPGP